MGISKKAMNVLLVLLFIIFSFTIVNYFVTDRTLSDTADIWMQPREIIVWVAFADLYHLLMGAFRIFCPGALLMLGFVIALERWAKSRQVEDE